MALKVEKLQEELKNKIKLIHALQTTLEERNAANQQMHQRLDELHRQHDEALHEINSNYRTEIGQLKRKHWSVLNKQRLHYEEKISNLMKQLPTVSLKESTEHEAPPMVPKHCRCRLGGCKSCICSKDMRACTQACGCKASGACKYAATEHVLQPVDLNRFQLQENLDETFELPKRSHIPLKSYSRKHLGHR